MGTLERRIAFGVGASWFTRCVIVIVQLVTMPVLFRCLGRGELGLWFLLGQSYAFVGLLDLGFTTALTRRIAFSRARDGQPLDAPFTTAQLAPLRDLIATGRVAYRGLGIGAFAIAWPIGYWFLSRLTITDLDPITVVAAWTILCLSHAAGVWAGLWRCVLQGIGYVGWDLVANSLLGVVVAAAQVAALALGGGILMLAVIGAVGAFVGREVTRRMTLRRHPELFADRGRCQTSELRELFGPAIRAWGTSLGAFLILKTDQYFIAAFDGTEEIPAYHAGYQLIRNAVMLATSLAVASGPFVSQLWSAGEHAAIRDLVVRNLRIAMILMASAVAFILIGGESLLRVWLGPGSYVGLPVLVVLSIMFTLETQHVVVSAASRATGDEAFAGWAIGAGILNLILTWLLIRPLGLLGVALGTMIAQLATNNWYAVVRGFRRLGMSLSRDLPRALAPAVATFVVAASGAHLAVKQLHPSSPVLATAVVAAVCGATLGGALWRTGLASEVVGALRR